MFAVSVFCRLRAALFLALALSGCVVVPTFDQNTNQMICCTAYATFDGYDFSQSYQKQGNQWKIHGSVSWKYLYGP